MPPLVFTKMGALLTCQVPRLSLPLVMGIVRPAPNMLDLQCAAAAGHKSPTGITTQQGSAPARLSLTGCCQHPRNICCCEKHTQLLSCCWLAKHLLPAHLASQ